MPYFIHNSYKRRFDYVLDSLVSIISQAGLLASGSSKLSRLPIFCKQWPIATLVPGYSGGPATALHRLPLRPLRVTR